MQLEGTDNLPDYETIESLRVLLEDQCRASFTHQEAKEIGESLIDLFTVLVEDEVGLLPKLQVEAYES